MKTGFFFTLVPALFATAALNAATLSCVLEPEQKTYRAGQCITCSLVLEPGENETPQPNMSLLDFQQDQTPELDVTQLRRVETDDPTKQIWSCEFTFLAPATHKLHPSLAGVMNHELPSNGFLKRYTLERFIATAPEREITVEALPEEGRPADFTGCVGDFGFNAGIEPADAAPGDVLVFSWTLTGRCADMISNVPTFEPGGSFKVYPPRVVERTDSGVRVEQSIVPLSRTSGVLTTGRFTVSVFDTATDSYKTLEAGPWNIAMHEREEDDDRLEDIPVPSAANGGAVKNPATELMKEAGIARFAPWKKAKKLFDVPAGAEYRVLERAGSWMRIALPDGATGWIDGRE